MKIYHVQFESDKEAAEMSHTIEHIDGVLEATSHQAFGHGPAYVVVVTQDDFNPELFQRESSLMYEENAVDSPNPLKNKKPKKPEIEVVEDLEALPERAEDDETSMPNEPLTDFNTSGDTPDYE